ncbi:hypothetical protein J3E71DRAFT_172075 [Bipolaris maydis]|nr:hypothetical protein J3E71DRAFT_172075 [Bipolaris maydis]
MDKNKQRVKHACNRCRFKKTKVTMLLIRLSRTLILELCDGERVCSKCRAEDSLCDYSNDTVQVRKRDSPVALLEAQNRQLRDAVQTLYEHIQAGHELPILPARSPEDNRPLVHDIIEYINTLRESTAPGCVAEDDAYCVSFAVTASNAATSGCCPTSTQHSFPFMAYNASQMNYECLESEVDQQELWTLMDTDPVEAARLYQSF